jgi:hypothetical protein
VCVCVYKRVHVCVRVCFCSDFMEETGTAGKGVGGSARWQSRQRVVSASDFTPAIIAIVLQARF